MRISDYYKEVSYIHYSNCHEDAEFALRHIKGKPRRILTVASALDNALAFLLLEPEHVLAFDFNETQVYLCNLKKCAIEHLDYEDCLVLTGFAQGDRASLYNLIREHLDPDTRDYFDSHLYLITQVGLVRCGRFEHYFEIFRKYILRFTHSKKTLRRFMHAESLEQQQGIYKSSFDNLRFRLLFRVFFSKAVMKLLGRDKDFFRYAKGSLSASLKRKFDVCALNNKNSDNPYLQFIVMDTPETFPAYLKKENFYKIKQNIHKLHIKKARFEDEVKSPNKYDFMYLSDVFEYMSEEKTARLSLDIYDALEEGGQVLFYNMMIERRLSAPLTETEIEQTGNRTFYYARCFSCEKV